MGQLITTQSAATTGKRAQVGLWFPYDTGQDYPFIDHYLLNGYHWRAIGATTSDPFSFINSSGYPNAMPTDGTYEWLTTLGTYFPDQSTPGTSNKYVFIKDGTASVQITSATTGATLTRTLGADSSNRQEYTITGSLNVGDVVNLQIIITAIPNNDTTSMKWYAISNESALNAGQLTTALFQQTYSRFGRIRFMDWMSTNGNPHVDWSNRVQMTQRSKVGVNVNNYCGIATLSGCDYSCPGTPAGNPTAYTDGLLIQFTTNTNVSYLTVTGFTNANPPVVTTSAAHGLNNGDQVMFPEGTFYWVAAPGIDPFTSGRIFTVASATATTFALSGYDSTTWGTFGTGNTANVSKPIRAKAGALPFAPIFASSGGSMYKPYATDLFNGSVSGNKYLIQLIYSSTLGGWTQFFANDGYRQGMPVELLVQTANELNVSAHFNVPHMANNAYVSGLATYILNNLNAALVATLELSNEVWNSQFNQTAYSNMMARNQGWAASNGYDYWHGYRFYGVMDLITTIYAGKMNRLNRAMAVNTGAYGTGGQTQRFQGTGTGVANYPISRADAIHIAPYFEGRRDRVYDAQSIWGYGYGNASQQAAALTWLDNFLHDDGGSGNYTVNWLNSTVIPAWIGIAHAPAPSIPAVKLEWYEGGPGQLGVYTGNVTAQIWNRTTGTNTPTYDPGTGAVTLTSTDCQNFIFGYLQSSQCAAMCSSNWNNFVAAGGSMPAQYVLVSPWSLGAQWGLKMGNIISGINTHAYDALISFNG